MTQDDSCMNTKSLTSENSLFHTDPQWRLRCAINNNDFITFKKLVCTAAVDLEYVYQCPDYKTCLELAICKENKKDTKKSFYKHFLQRKVDSETSQETYKMSNKKKIVIFLLQQKVEVNRINETYDAAPIHFAVENGNIGALEALLKDNRVDINVKSKGNTALLLAIKKIQDLDDDRKQDSIIYEDMIKMLLKAGCNVNAPDIKGVTPVFFAVKQSLERVVTLILDNAHVPVDLDTYKDNNGETARHYLKEAYPHLEPIFNSKKESIGSNVTFTLFSHLLLHNESNFLRDYNQLVRKNEHQQILAEKNDNNTMLQLATEKGLENAVQILLKSGADPNATCTNNMDQPVAIACRNGFNSILKMFIENGTTLFKPVNGESLLHILIRGMKFTSKDPKTNFAECLNTLLTNPKVQSPPIDVNHYDFNGNTVLHYAARNGDQNIVIELLRKGACAGFRNKFNEPPLADINAKTLETYLDECVTAKRGRLRDNDYEIRFKYSFLVYPNTLYRDKAYKPPLHENTSNGNNSVISPEMEVLVYMTQNEDLRPLLKHPIITSFLYLKWQRISYIFIANLVFYTMFWLSLNLYIILGNVIEKDQLNSLKALNVITYIAANVGLIVLLLRELFQLVFSSKYHNYLRSLKNWLEISLILVTAWVLFSDSSQESTKQLSAVTILLSSAELVLLIGHFPNLSTYVVMLRTVCINFLKFILWYCILIIAFALSFYVLFKNLESKGDQTVQNPANFMDNNFFEDPGSSLFKTLVMLTGEFDTGSMQFRIFPITSHIIFIVFVFMIPIVLFNLLNGLAVSDTQEIRANAELVGHISTVQLISYIETIFIGKLYTNSKIWTYLPSCLQDVKIFKPKTLCITPFAKRISLFPDFMPLYTIVVKPNRDNSIEIPRLAHQEIGDDHEDIESGKCCFNVCQSYRLDPNIVKNAKILLYKKSQGSELNEIKSKLSQILQKLESR